MDINLDDFKVIDEFDEMYMVDKDGNVYSKYINRFLKPTLYYGYYCVVLYDRKNKKQVSKYVHRLVATYFLDNPNKYDCVNHKDENKLNNNVENLEWCTKSYNCTYHDIHKLRGLHCSETIRKNGGSHRKGIKMSEEQKRKISESHKKRKETGKVIFHGNQYVDAQGNRKNKQSSP